MIVSLLSYHVSLAKGSGFVFLTCNNLFLFKDDSLVNGPFLDVIRNFIVDQINVKIKVEKIIYSGGACPYQLSAVCEDGREIYLRYRGETFVGVF